MQLHTKNSYVLTLTEPEGNQAHRSWTTDSSVALARLANARCRSERKFRFNTHLVSITPVFYPSDQVTAILIKNEMCSHDRLLQTQLRHSAIEDTDDVHPSSTVTCFTHKLHLRETEKGQREREREKMVYGYERYNCWGYTSKHMCNFISVFTGSSTSRVRYWSSMGLPML